MQSVQPRQAAHCTLVTVYTRVKGKLRYLALRIGGPDSPRCPAAALPSVHCSLCCIFGHWTLHPVPGPAAGHTGCQLHTAQYTLYTLYCAVLHCTVHMCQVTQVPTLTTQHPSLAPLQAPCRNVAAANGWRVVAGGTLKQVLSAGSAWSVML